LVRFLFDVKINWLLVENWFKGNDV
jgi:hypothetical protein